MGQTLQLAVASGGMSGMMRGIGVWFGRVGRHLMEEGA